MKTLQNHRFILVILLLVLAAGCQRIPMHERGAGIYLRISVDQSLDPAMTALLDFDARPSLRDIVVGKKPELVRVCFYDAVSHELVAEDFLPAEGGFVNVAAGVYDVIVYSLGTEATQISGTEVRAGGYAFTDPTGIRVKLLSAQAKEEGDEPIGTEEQPVIFEPDHVFAGKIAGAMVSVHPDDAEPEVLATELSRISESWILEIADIVGAAHIQKAEVYVTGQAAGRIIWDGRTTNHPCALGLETEIDIQRGRLFSVFNTFGKYPQPDCDVMVYVLVTTNSNAHCLYFYDVTDQWLNPDNTAHLIRIGDRIEIPGDDYHGSGFNPVVTGWDGVEIPVIIGY
jgi:hypothetical protein